MLVLPGVQLSLLFFLQKHTGQGLTFVEVCRTHKAALGVQACPQVVCATDNDTCHL